MTRSRAAARARRNSSTRSLPLTTFEAALPEHRLGAWSQPGRKRNDDHAAARWTVDDRSGVPQWCAEPDPKARCVRKQAPSQPPAAVRPVERSVRAHD